MDNEISAEPNANSDSSTDHPMLETQQPTPKPRKPLRLWPGVIAGVVLALAWFIVPIVMPSAGLYGMLVSMVSVLVILVWWLAFSRARWFERLGAIALIAIAIAVTLRFVHISIENGAMGYLFFVIAVPVMALVLVTWAVVTKRLTDNLRRGSLVGMILLVCAGFTLIRTGGLDAEGDLDLHFRWTKTPEELLLAQGEEPAAIPPTSAAATGSEWPGFRGPNRDGIVRGTSIKSDWSAAPPVEVWRRQIGPGWSSFAVSGDLLYTQEQRGTEEIVSCYSVSTGKPVWKHKDAARFWESNAGAGPRGTPTLSNGRVYTLGATGIVNVLDATHGTVVWSRNAATDTKTKLPGWGFSSSPLVVADKVIVATAGNLIAYNIANGEPSWSQTEGGGGYSSPQLVTIAGVPQVVFLNATAASGFDPADGKRLWQHTLPSGTRIVQPAFTADGNVLSHDGEGNDMRRIAVSFQTGGWSAAERWASVGLNPYFSDFVVHDGYTYGFSGGSIACANLADGERKWKGGSYGHGQLILLADQALMVVLSEAGELALVKATPDQFTELGRFKAIKGKTWNHPVLVNDILLVRNGEEMAAFRLARS